MAKGAEEMSDILVIETSNLMLKSSELKELQKSIIAMKAEGVVVLPWYCKVSILSDDCEVVYEKENKHG